MLPKHGQLLRIFVSESDKHQGKPVYEWIVLKAREHGLAGATVLRGLAGFGRASRIHTAKVLRLSEDLPLVIEIVDIEEKIETFIPEIESALHGGLMTVERVDVRLYQSETKHAEK